jgi:hypothetical protein
VTIDGGNFTLDGGVQGAVTRRLIPGRPIWRSLHTGENRPSDRSD